MSVDEFNPFFIFLVTRPCKVLNSRPKTRTGKVFAKLKSEVYGMEVKANDLTTKFKDTVVWPQGHIREYSISVVVYQRTKYAISLFVSYTDSNMIVMLLILNTDNAFS